LQSRHSDITIGQFHDGLRRMYDEGSIYLHPWTGPLYALPEPALSLMIGHEVAYYASHKNGTTDEDGGRRTEGGRENVVRAATTFLRPRSYAS
jgi:hypothetical protein